jgi:hypothetical protein
MRLEAVREKGQEEGQKGETENVLLHFWGLWLVIATNDCQEL